MRFESMYWVRWCLPLLVFGISITICSGYPRPAYPSVVGLLLIHVMKRFNSLLLIFLYFSVPRARARACVCVCVCVGGGCIFACTFILYIIASEIPLYSNSPSIFHPVALFYLLLYKLDFHITLWSWNIHKFFFLYL